MSGIRILSTGSYVPSEVFTNNDFSEYLETSDEWIVERTGIKERRFARNETNRSLAIKVSEEAIIRSGIDRAKIGTVIVATFTPDDFTPSISCLLQSELGLSENLAAFDMNAACSGFVYGYNLANAILAQEPEKYVLLVCSEKLSNYLDFSDRNTCVLFGDGAGAFVLEYCEEKGHCSVFGTRGNRDVLYCEAKPDENDRLKSGYLQMNGKDVYRFATEVLHKAIDDLLLKANLSSDDIDYYVCHQANKRIISYVYKKMNLPEEKFYVNLDRYGNTSSASIPLALDEMNKKGMLKRGDKIVCVGFGAGLTWGAVLINW